MGGRKRSGSSSDSDQNVCNREILKRINKIEQKLKKRRKSSKKRKSRSRSRSRSGSHSANTRYERQRPQTRLPYNRGSLEREEERDYRNPSDYESYRHSADHASPIRSPFIHRRSRSASATPPPATPQGPARPRDKDDEERGQNNGAGDTVEGEQSDTLILNDNIAEEYLKMLGDDPNENKENFFELHPALSARWSHIITNGLSSEVNDEWRQKYPFPSNCPALTPPQINPEVISILPQFHIKRDKSHLEMQARLSRGMSALGKGINIILNDKGAIPREEKEKVLLCLGDSAKILADLSHHSTKLRRTLIMPQMDRSVRELAENTSPGKYLFGEEFGNKVKELKTMEKTSKDLKPAYAGEKRLIQNKKFKKEVPSRIYRPSSTQTRDNLNRRRPVRSQREVRPQKGYPSKPGPSNRHWRNP